MPEKGAEGMMLQQGKQERKHAFVRKMLQYIQPMARQVSNFRIRKNSTLSRGKAGMGSDKSPSRSFSLLGV